MRASDRSARNGSLARIELERRNGSESIIGSYRYRRRSSSIVERVAGIVGRKAATDVQGEVGIIYLLHFDTPYKQARHYVGWTQNERTLKLRLEHHRSGSGSRLCRAVAAAGIGWTVAKTWSGTRSDERSFKNGKCTPSRCPLCRAARLAETNIDIRPPDALRVLAKT